MHTTVFLLLLFVILFSSLIALAKTLAKTLKTVLIKDNDCSYFHLLLDFDEKTYGLL